jgi:hypothetical protein
MPTMTDRTAAICLSGFCLFLALILASLVTLRDDYQAQLHRRDVVPALNQCKVPSP